MLSEDRFGDNLLRLAITVHLRRVNQAHGKLVSHAGGSHLDSVCVVLETRQGYVSILIFCGI